MEKARNYAKEKKELSRLKKEQGKKQNRFYLFYMLLILSLIYIVDEISTNLPNNLLSEINLAINVYPKATSLGYTLSDIDLAVYGAKGSDELLSIVSSGLSSLSLISLLGNFMLVFSLLYRPLADRYGRKIFLFFNTFGMGLSSLLFFLSNNIYMYAFSFFLLRFFVTPDQQIVYLFEIAPKKHRNTIYSLVKGFAELGLLFIALLRHLFLNSDDYQSYKWIFLSIAIATFAISFLALLFARESRAFLLSRIAYLEESDEERASNKKEASKKQGGLIAALRLTFSKKQLLFICLSTLIVELIYSPCNGYAAVLNNGFLGVGGLSQDDCTKIAFIFPISCAFVSATYGLFSDKFGRKLTSILLCALCFLSYLLLCVGLYLGWSIYALGLILGVILGADWGNGDVLSLLASESSPTNLRSSVMASWSLFFGGGMVLSQLFATIIPILFGAKYISLAYLCLTLPSMLISLFILVRKVEETKGTSLESANEAS